MRLINYITNFFVYIFLQPEIIIINDDFFSKKLLNPNLKPA